MGRTEDAIYFLVRHYPNPHELSRVRLTTMVFLADWRAAVRHREQITQIPWADLQDGHNVDYLTRLLAKDPDLQLTEAQTDSGGNGLLIRVARDRELNHLGPLEREVLSFIISVSSRYPLHAFLRLARSTYPYMIWEKTGRRSLSDLANEYRNLRRAEP